MKKYLSYAIALAAVLTASCNKENPSADQPGKGNTGLRSFTAYVDGADSKTVFGESADGKTKSLWKGEESIKVLSKGQEAVTFKTANLEPATESATFNIAEGSTLGTGPWFAVYPDAATPSWTEGTTVTGLALKAEQVAVVDGYEPANHFAIAYTENETLNFKNLVSFIKVTIEVAGVSEVCIFGNNKEKIAGEFTAEWNKGVPTVSEGAVPYAKIQGELIKGSVYYIACLPCTFEHGFTLEAVIDGKKFQKKSGNKYTLARNKVLDLGEVSAWPSIHSNASSNASGDWETKAMTKVTNGIYKTTLSSQKEFEFKMIFKDVWARPVSNNITTGKWYNLYDAKWAGNVSVAAGEYDVYADVANGAVCFVNKGEDMPVYNIKNRALHILCEGTNWQYMHRWKEGDGSWEYHTDWDKNEIQYTGNVTLPNDKGEYKVFTYWPIEPELNGQTFSFLFRSADKKGQTDNIASRKLDEDIYSWSDGKNNLSDDTYSVTPVKY